MTSAPSSNPSIECAELYSDDDVIAVNKAAGIVTQPGAGHANDTLMNGLFARERTSLARLGVNRDWGLLHRLDRETSGVILVAKNERAYDHIRSQFERRSIEKTYLAIARGRVAGKHGCCRQPLEEVRRAEMKVSVPSPRGESAVTHWRILASSKELSLVACSIETGKLHQIRAHLALLGAPVEGDRIYRSLLPPNTSKPPPDQRAAPPTLRLHAWRIGFTHPTTGKRVDVEAPLPASFLKLVSQCIHGKGAVGDPGSAAVETLLRPVRSAQWWREAKV